MGSVRKYQKVNALPFSCWRVPRLKVNTSDSGGLYATTETSVVSRTRHYLRARKEGPEAHVNAQSSRNNILMHA